MFASNNDSTESKDKSNSSIIKLNRQKGTIQAKITKLQTFLNVLKGLNVNEKSVAIKIKSKLDSISLIKSGISELLKIYEDLPEEVNTEESIQNLLDLDDELENIEVSLKLLYSNHNIEEKKSNLVESSISNVKLPDIPLPQFYGKYEEFQNFKTQFQSIIGDNTTLNENQKLYYLKASLKGEAKQIETCEDTFSSLFSALKLRYENKRAVVDAHISNLLLYEKLNSESPSNLRNFLDNVKRNLRSLKSLNYSRNELSDVLILNILLQKLDRESRKQYELTQKSNEVPSLDELISFLEERTNILEGLSKNLSTSKNASPNKYYSSSNRKSLFLKSNQTAFCIFCKLSNHALYQCVKFKSLDVHERFKFVKKNALCISCFSQEHKLALCQSRYSCRICKKQHNTLLHRSEANDYLNGVNNSSSSHVLTDEPINNNNQSEDLIPPSTCLFSKNKNVLLATAIVWVYNNQGKFIKARICLDNGSQSNYICHDFVERANLQKTKINIPISSLGGTRINIKYKTNAMISNGNGSFSASLEFLVASKITDMVPANYLDIQGVCLPDISLLADPDFASPSAIDMLLGAEIFFNIVKSEKIYTSVDTLMFQNSVFGYIAVGFIESNQQTPTFCGFSSQISNLEKSLENFWKIEEINPNEKIVSDEAKYCEEHFVRTHKRNSSGRYIVTMPMKDEIEFLGDSKRIAETRLKQLNRRLLKSDFMLNLYNSFMEEYEKLGHMEKVENDTLPENYYYLPHHGVYNPEKSTTKLRVVFNASSPIATGQSLNDFLLKGEVIEDVFTTILRFRTHKYAFTSDVKNMFRQILINPCQRDFLRILWSSQPNEQPSTFVLNTVTYGTASAPFLATRVLKQLALDEADSYPLAAKVILSNVYMDDILSGAPSLEMAQELQQQLISLLQKGGMSLHKWTSNSPKLLNSSLDLNNQKTFLNDKNDTVKTLGINWHHEDDCFIFKVNIKAESFYSKRNVLSVIARLYDPIGLLGPIITKAKILLQKLWLQKLNWEDPLPELISEEWENFVTSLKCIENLKIERYIFSDPVETIKLVGFADSSESAYGAVIYMQSIMKNDKTVTKLIASKSRVAPLKTLTIPRLELSACLLLSQLLGKICHSLEMQFEEIILYTDSTIALAWIKTPPYKLKTFIGNRVSKINTLTANCQWRHISSNLNPADIISRGLNPQELLSASLWWKGPGHLPDSCVTENLNYGLETDLSSNDFYISELKKQSEISLTLSTHNTFVDNFLCISNDFYKLIRIFSFLCRFIWNVRNAKDRRKSGPLTSLEIQRAKFKLVNLTQVLAFSDEIKTLQKGDSVKGSQVSSLNPFLDNEKLIRVGGRINNSNVLYNQKFPILLPKNHKLTLIIMTYYHIKYLHVGAQTLLYLVRQEFWPLNGRNTARKVVHECVTCFKNKPKVMEQIMGNLPPERVTPSPPFAHTGVDFCGPFHIHLKYRNQRKGIVHKIYVAIFICLATRAIHLEIVSDLTTDSFIAALKRFIARRGKSIALYSDNGSNFVGANNELKRLHKLVNKPDEVLSNCLASDGIDWRFIPPRAPHFGGLWEAGVKSFKFHLKRVVGSLKLTYEEFLTITTQIEGILNSRPISPLSNDANDLEPLTPAHFLIGRPVSSILEPDHTNLSDNVLKRWQRTTKITQQFWTRWQRDYLSHCQQRTKWQFMKDNISLGAMVMIKEDNMPVTTWVLGRITEIIMGKDKKVRVCMVKTKLGILKRPISKLAVLPIKTD